MGIFSLAEEVRFELTIRFPVYRFSRAALSTTQPLLPFHYIRHRYNRVNVAMNQVHFLKSFLKDRNVAAVAETSRATVRKILSKIDFSKDLTVVEYGPGTGVCSLPVLERLSPNSRFIGIESNADFARQLRKVEDPRLTVVEGDARDIDTILKKLGLPAADIVISSIPFTFFSPAMRRDLVCRTASVINPGGAFLVYQYSPLMKGYLAESFPIVRLSFSPLNIPGVFIMEARKSF